MNWRKVKKLGGGNRIAYTNKSENLIKIEDGQLGKAIFSIKEIEGVISKLSPSKLFNSQKSIDEYLSGNNE